MTSSSILSSISEYFLVQSIASRSINSKADGVIPALKTAETASQAFSEELNGTSKEMSFVGRGINLKTILVIIPRVPSLPTNN